MFYNSASHLYEFCNGTNWVAMGPTGAGGSCGGPTTNLVGWWELTDGSGTSAADSSGNGDTGTLDGSPTWATTGPYNGGGVTFNGTAQYISVCQMSPGLIFPASGPSRSGLTHRLFRQRAASPASLPKTAPANYHNYYLSINSTNGCPNLAWQAGFTNSSGSQLSQEARELLDSIDTVRTTAREDGENEEQPDLVGLRDRALIGVMVYTFAAALPCSR